MDEMDEETEYFIAFIALARIHQLDVQMFWYPRLGSAAICHARNWVHPQCDPTPPI